MAKVVRRVSLPQFSTDLLYILKQVILNNEAIIIETEDGQAVLKSLVIRGWSRSSIPNTPSPSVQC